MGHRESDVTEHMSDTHTHTHTQEGGASTRQSNLAGYSPWGRRESDVTEHTHTDTYTHACMRARMRWTRQTGENQETAVFLDLGRRGASSEGRVSAPEVWQC